MPGVGVVASGTLQLPDQDSINHRLKRPFSQNQYDAMTRLVMIRNNHGLPRLDKYYAPKGTTVSKDENCIAC
jgi:hypothetical protein